MRRVYFAVAVAALLVRGGAFVPTPTPDAVEYEMIARSLAHGAGFTLPVRVRLDESGPVRHDARGERAPVFPLVLAAVDRVVDDGRAEIVPGLQVVNALIGVVDALLIASIMFARTGNRRAAFAAGVLAAWSITLVAASCRLVAEPIGLLFVLLALRCDERTFVRHDATGSGLAAGALLGLARLARPEAVAAALVLLVFHARRRVFLSGFLAVTGLALALGAGTPQSFLLRVTNFRDVMFDWRGPPPASALDFVSTHGALIVRHIYENALDLGVYAVRFGHAVPLLGLVALARRDRIAATAFSLALFAACVWSTRDHTRFLVAPLVLLVVPAVAETWRLLDDAALWGPRPARASFALLLALALFPLAQRHARDARLGFTPKDSGIWSVPTPLTDAVKRLPPGEAFAAVSPWSLALASGRDGLLLPIHLDAKALRSFLDASPEVRVVVLRDVAHDALTPEPWHYALDLAPIASSESVRGARLFWLSARGSRGSPSSR